MQEYVAGFMFNPSMTQVALIRKNRPPWQAGKLNAVGGKVEPGEDPLRAMVREFEEETGVHHENWEPTVILSKDGAFRVHFFRTFSEKAYQVKTATDEPIDLYMLDDLNDLNAGPSSTTVPNLAWLVPIQLDLHLAFPVVLVEK